MIFALVLFGKTDELGSGLRDLKFWLLATVAIFVTIFDSSYHHSLPVQFE